MHDLFCSFQRVCFSEEESRLQTVGHVLRAEEKADEGEKIWCERRNGPGFGISKCLVGKYEKKEVG